MIFEILIEFAKWLFICSLVWIGLTYIFRHYRDFGAISSRWHHSFAGEKFSTQEIYGAISAAIKARNIPNVSISTATHSQGLMLQGRREYLRIVRGDSMFLICAAPFADDFFVSYWLGQPIDFFHDLVPRLPFVGGFLARLLFSKTYYQMDTETMFLESVKHAVHEVVDALTKEKGLRPLTDLERLSVVVPPQYR